MDKLTVEQIYERDFGEPWSALESRVRARHPHVFAILDWYEENKPVRKWWQIWK